jgi:hypothetical protein
MNSYPNGWRVEAGAPAAVGCEATLTITDLWLCLLPVSFFLSIVSLV